MVGVLDVGVFDICFGVLLFVSVGFVDGVLISLDVLFLLFEGLVMGGGFEVSWLYGMEVVRLGLVCGVDDVEVLCFLLKMEVMFVV